MHSDLLRSFARKRPFVQRVQKLFPAILSVYQLLHNGLLKSEKVQFTDDVFVQNC